MRRWSGSRPQIWRKAWAWRSWHAVFSTGVQKVRSTLTTPHDHFVASPDRLMFGSGFRRIGGTNRSPTIGIGIVPAAGGGGEITESIPHDHFASGPDCRVT